MTPCVITSARTCNTPAMRLIWLARGLGVSGLSAVAAVAAHEGPAALTSGRALIVAMAGASVAAMGVALLLVAAVSRYARAARVRRGDLLAARLDSTTAPGASALVAAMLVCQGAAHISLTVFGVAAHGGPPASLALHVVLGVGAAAVMIGFERLLRAAGATLADAIACAIGTLPAGGSIRAFRPVRTPLPASPDRAHRGRAPPLAAGFGI
jgi:hypothetical protein